MRLLQAERRDGWEAALIGVTVVWGSTFVVVKDAVDKVPPFAFNSARFGLAALALATVGAGGLTRLGRRGLRDGAILGVLLFVGYAFQTAGLRHTEASVAGFVTGMFVVFTPILSALLLRRPPSRSALAGVAAATVGLGLLSLESSFTPGFGELLVLACAAAFAGHIVGLGAWSSRHAALPLTVVQLATAALLHGASAWAWEPSREAATRWDGSVLAAIALTALLASAAGFWVQTAVQRSVPPTRTAIILTMEPVFAGVFGYALLGERLDARGWAGAGLILAGMLVAELGATRERVSAVPAGRPDEPAQSAGVP